MKNIYTHYPEFDELFQSAININGMPDDFFTADFYRHRMDMINNRIKELSNSEIIPILHKSYKDHYGKNFRMIEDWNKFSIEELSIAPKMFSNEVLLKILERILININENRSGLPDLLVYNDSTLFMAEVKSERDKLSEIQEYWIDFLETAGIKVELCLINHTERQIANLKKKIEKNKKLIKISFGYSTSKKRDQAIEFAKKQPAYFTSGEGKEQIHGAVFDVNDIESLYTMLDLTSGWKSQKIEVDGEAVKSTKLRNGLWCFREKVKQGESLDYCNQEGRYGNKNVFGCRMVSLEIDRWTKYGYISSDSGDWIFDKKELEEYKNNIIQNLSYCPLFNPNKVENVFNKIPDTINPVRDKDWAYISSEGDRWLNYNGKWYTTSWGKSDFPGIAAMVGICKLDKAEMNHIIRSVKRDEMLDSSLPNHKISIELSTNNIPLKPQKKSKGLKRILNRIAKLIKD